jgi:hypothetical protein
MKKALVIRKSAVLKVILFRNFSKVNLKKFFQRRKPEKKNFAYNFYDFSADLHTVG